jgi:NADPH2:quinone reductase
MKAIRIHETGTPDVMVMDELDVPVPGPGEVLIKVAVAGVNFTDLMQRQGVYMSRANQRALPLVLGTEVAGTVVTAGPGVVTPVPGTRVIALVQGGYAEYAIAPAEDLIVIPDALDYARAVAFLVQGITAYQLLRDSTRLEPGESVLVHSAAGGVGSLAVQLARILGGGTVIATVGGPEKMHLVRDLGADVVIDYKHESWAEQVRDATGGRGVDVILDAVGGDVTECGLTCLAPFGRMAVYGMASLGFASFAGMQLMQGNQAIIGYWLTTWLQRRPAIARAKAELVRLGAEGKLRPILKNAFPLARAADAHRAIAARGTVGKVALIV